MQLAAYLHIAQCSASLPADEVGTTRVSGWVISAVGALSIHAKASARVPRLTAHWPLIRVCQIGLCKKGGFSKATPGGPAAGERPLHTAAHGSLRTAHLLHLSQTALATFAITPSRVASSAGESETKTAIAT